MSTQSQRASLISVAAILLFKDYYPPWLDNMAGRRNRGGPDVGRRRAGR